LLENQFIYHITNGCKLIFFAPLGAGVNEENQLIIWLVQDSQVNIITELIGYKINLLVIELKWKEYSIRKTK
jgi:hypothetical protein